MMGYVYRIISENPKVHVGDQAVCRNIRAIDHIDVTSGLEWLRIECRGRVFVKVGNILTS
jgi:hypothetical protein